MLFFIKHIVRILLWIFLVVTAALSVLPGEELESSLHIQTIHSSGAFLHIGAYGFLTFLAWFAYKKRYKWWILGLFAYGFSLETIQIWVPHRTFNPFDLVSNGIGLIAGVVLILSGKQFFKRKSQT